jgi:GTP1/Obg family GTP-binding protein
MFAENKTWQELYMQTILEVNATKMPERIAATRQAIFGRLRDLEHDSDHHAERHKMQDALNALSAFETETRTMVDNSYDRPFTIG